MPNASRICASTKCPIRHFAMTGMVTASMIERIRSGSDIRATPPSLRMSAGTRSRAITAHAPASCAVRACSGVTTSMITPPFSIWARPALTLKDPFTAPFPLREALRSATNGILRRGIWLEPFQHQGPLGGVLAVGQEPVPVQAGQHVHLLEHVQERGHRASSKVRIRGGPGLFAPRVELADEEQRFHRRERDSELADRAVGLLGVEVQDHAVAMPLQRPVQVAAQDLSVEEPDGDLSRRRLGGKILVA